MVFYVVACFYGYGALVHVLNIAGLGGFDWINAPFKWQVLDVVYLGIDLVVLFGFFARWKPALVFFFVAAISQIVLYTVLRAWILDVPEAYAVNAEQASYLTSLVVFHLVSLVLVIGAYRVAGGQFFRARGAEAT